jgi:outer membrane receptor protein involved in Fe transport
VKHKNAGSVVTWKAGLDWQITDSWRIRAMAQHAVRAPNNFDLFEAQGVFANALIGNNTTNDPCSASANPSANGNVEKCIVQGLTQSQIGEFEASSFYPVDFIFGGNPDLVPEDSDTFTAGFVFSPISVPNLTIAVDYFKLEVTDTIGGIDATSICFDPLNTDGVFCELLERDSTGNVFKVTELSQNRGLLSTEGVDVMARYQLDLPASLAIFEDFASLSVNSSWTHTTHHKTQENVVTSVMECIGFFGWPCGFANPKNRVTTNFNYSSGSFTAHLTWRWIDGMLNGSPISSGIFGVPDPVLAIPELPSWSYLDLGVSYRFGETTEMRLGINNLTDKEPAFMADQTFSNNTDASMFDVFGRSYYFSVRYELGSDR